jgi:hypothetical protein
MTLVQVLVASAVLVTALLPVFALLTQSVRNTEVSLDELRAAYLAEEALDQLRFLAFEPGYAGLRDLPAVNPPPHDSWVDTSDSEGEYYQLGLPLPHPIQGTGEVLPVDTQGWRQLGAPIASDPNDPLIESLSRLYLSPLPEGWQRRFQIYPPPLDASGTINPDLRRVEVEIVWSRQFQGMQAAKERRVRLSTLIGNPGRLQ